MDDDAMQFCGWLLRLFDMQFFFDNFILKQIGKLNSLNCILYILQDSKQIVILFYIYKT